MPQEPIPLIMVPNSLYKISRECIQGMGAFFTRLHWCLKREFSFLNKEQAPNWFVSFDASKPQTPGYLNCLTWQYTVQRGKRPYTSRGGSLKFFIWSITFSKPERNFHMGFRQATFYLAELFRQATFYLAELFRQIAFPIKKGRVN